jgi:hypothetical protein
VLFIKYWKWEKSKEVFTKNKKIRAIIVFLLFLIPLLSGWFLLTHWYSIDIERRYTSENEKEAIRISEEEINYSEIFNLSRYDRSWTNFIDEEVIDHYSNKVKEYRTFLVPIHSTFHYHAEAGTYDSLKVDYNNHDLTIRGDNEVIHRETYKFSDGGYVKRFNNSNNNSNEGFDYLSLGDIFEFNSETNEFIIVKMDLAYHYTCGSLCGHSTKTTQYLIFDSELNLLLILLNGSWKTIS